MLYPLVSVCVAAYNHENFIEDLINSIIHQDYTNIELIITDDASADNTLNAILQFDDTRIRLFKHDTNKGPSVALNNCFDKARGKYMSITGSDDVFHPQKISTQVSYLEKNPTIGLVFSRAKVIDRNGSIINMPLVDEVEHPLNQTRERWLAEFFRGQNRLYAPSVMMRREVLDRVGRFDPRLLQTQDMDFWIRAARFFDFHVLRDSLLYYRQLDNQENLSANTPDKQTRCHWEITKVLHRFRAIDCRDQFLAIFPQARHLSELGLSLEMMLAICAINEDLTFTRNFGLDLLYEILAQPEIAEVLEPMGYGFTGLINATSKAGVYGSSADRWALQQAENWQAAHKNLFDEYERLRSAFEESRRGSR